MKKLLTILAMAALASTAFGQFIAPPRAGNALTIPSGGYFFSEVNSALTNFASPIAFPLAGNARVFLYMDAGATNMTTAATQALNFQFQVSADNSKWSGPNANYNHGALVLSLTGLPTNHPVWLDLSAAFPILSPTNTSGKLTALRSIRLHSVSNAGFKAANSNTTIFTNLWFIQGTE